MRLEQYIKEDTVREIHDFDKLIDALKRDCRPWISQAKGNFAFRGMKENPQSGYFQKPVRKDRKPSDMAYDLYLKFDELFEDKFGWAARSQGMFCTGNKVMAELYGNLFIVFPVGSFKFIWSKDVLDLFTDIKKDKFFKLGLVDNIKSLFMEDGDEYAFNKGIQNIINTYTDKNLEMAIESQNEIMVNCDKYYCVEYSRLTNVQRETLRYL